jgi:hypothetical protein
MTVSTKSATAAVLTVAGRVGAGVAGGLAGGLVFGVLMQTLGLMTAVARLVNRDSAGSGWLVHMAIAAFVGALYGLLLGPLSTVPSAGAVLGVMYGCLWWVLGGLTLMPLRLGLGLFVLDTTAWQSLAGHVAYGLLLGVGYAWVGPRPTDPYQGPPARHPAYGSDVDGPLSP